ncbi:hypothetical protein JCM10450v2_006150 [Rhodotorula kratochvilovae]
MPSTLEQDSPPVPPPPPPAASASPTSWYVLRNARQVTVGGGAGQYGAAAIATIAWRSYERSEHFLRKAMENPVIAPDLGFKCLGDVGIATLRGATMLPSAEDPLFNEALLDVGLPVEFQRVELLVGFPRGSAAGLQQVHDEIVSFTHRRVAAWISQLNSLPVTNIHPADLLVPRIEVEPRPQGGVITSWQEPIVRHQLVLTPHPAANLGPVTPPRHTLLPILGTNVSLGEANVYLETYGAPVLLHYQLEHMWHAIDQHAPLHQPHISSNYRLGVAYTAAFNIWLLYEMEHALLRALAAEPNLQATSPFGAHLHLRRLDGVRQLALNILGLSHDDAHERRHPSDIFLEWILREFGTAMRREEFAVECVVWLRAFWPSIGRDSPEEGRDEREEAVEQRFCAAFKRILELFHPVDGVVPGGAHPRSRRNSDLYEEA